MPEQTEHLEANRPTTPTGETYHLHTKPGDLAPLCLLVGDPERAEKIAAVLFEEARKVGDNRGLKSFTGRAYGIEMSVVTTGMGGASTGIVLPEAVETGGRIFIRVGSCGSIQPEPELGDSIICTGAVRLEGASKNWAPIEFPAIADYRVVAALVDAAQELKLPHHVGLGATTDCFREGQARPDASGYVPPRLQQQHDELARAGVMFYSMEEATLFVWASTHGRLMTGAIDAVFGNRPKNIWGKAGEENAARIAILALSKLSYNALKH